MAPMPRMMPAARMAQAGMHAPAMTAVQRPAAPTTSAPPVLSRPVTLPMMAQAAAKRLNINSGTVSNTMNTVKTGFRNVTNHLSNSLKGAAMPPKTTAAAGGANPFKAAKPPSSIHGMMNANPKALGPTAAAMQPIMRKAHVGTHSIKNQAIGQGKGADVLVSASNRANAPHQKAQALGGLRKIERTTGHMAQASASKYSMGQNAFKTALTGIIKEAPAVNPFKAAAMAGPVAIPKIKKPK